ncbi:MAG: ATP-binding protein [Pseudomonadota bacterium]
MPQRIDREREKNTESLGGDDLLRLRAGRDAAVQAAREAVRDTTRLTRLLTILNDSGPLDLLLDRILSTLSELFLADIVVLLDPVGTGSFAPLAAVGLSEDILPLPFSEAQGSFTQRLMHTDAPVLIENADADPTIDFQLRDMGAETIIGLPVDGSQINRGALILARCSPIPFARSEVGLLRTMAYRIGRTLIEAQRSVQFEKIVQSGREISCHLDLITVSAEAVNMFPVIVSADASALVLSAPDGEFYCAAQTGLEALCTTALSRITKHLMASSPLGRGEPYSTADLTTILLQNSPVPLSVAPVKAFLAIPIHRKDLIHGVLFAVRFSAIAFNRGSLQIAMLYAEQISAAIENASLYQAVHHELAERKRLEEEQRKWERQQQQLEKANSLNSMAGAIAHHFNNQLGVVMGSLELAIDELPRDAEITEILAIAMKGARKAAEVSGSMLTYLGQTTGLRTPLNLCETCRQSLPLLQTAAPKGLVIKADLPSPGLILSANANQIQQVLTHLVTNALEAVGERQGAVDLTLKKVSYEHISDVNRYPIDWQANDLIYACIEVADAGCGIAEANIEKLFDPFFSSKFTGRGLGLPVVLGIVKTHGGVITVESRQGKGSTFRVYLPMPLEDVARPPDKTSRSLAMEGSGTVLLVEDEEMMRSMATTMLSRLGFKVFAAKDGLEALELFRDRRDDIHVVLCDLSMPRMNGWETVAALRLIRPDIPVVLASGHDESRVFSGGHPDTRYQIFLHKPYQKAALKDAIDRAMVGTAVD